MRRFLSIGNIVWKTLNNSFLLAVASFFMAAYFSRNLDDIHKVISMYFDGSSVFMTTHLYLLKYVMYVFLFFGVVNLIRSWIELKLNDEKWYYRFWPIVIIRKWLLKLKYKKNHLVVLKSTIKEFTTISNEPYYEVSDPKNLHSKLIKSYDSEKPIAITFKLPARLHLAIPDFQDLKCLRRLSNQGFAVRVIIIDVPASENDEIDMDKKVAFTEHIVKNLVSGARIYRLSKILAKRDINPFIMYLFGSCIPYYATEHHNILQKNGIGAALSVNYMIFPFLLKAFSNLSLVKFNVYVIHWVDHLNRWREYSDFPKESLPNLQISGLIIGETFRDPNKEKLLTTLSEYPDASFNVTEDMSKIAEKLLSNKIGKNKSLRWDIPNAYVEFLAKDTFGLTRTISTNKTKKSTIEDFISMYGGSLAESSAFEVDNQLETLEIRYALFKEINRIQKRIVKR